jgi:hypothetical protein
MQVRIPREATAILIEPYERIERYQTAVQQLSSGLPRSYGGALPDHSGHKIHRFIGVIFIVPKTA